MEKMTFEQLSSIMPTLSRARAIVVMPNLQQAMDEFEINTPKRVAAFSAQLAYESGQLRYMEEAASGRAYEGRVDLGNTDPGDGVKYKGRGPIQLTGKKNYELAGRALGIDLIKDPWQVVRPQVGFRIAGWFWKTNGLNELADREDFKKITRSINGGYNGLSEREKFYEAAKKALGVT